MNSPFCKLEWIEAERQLVVTLANDPAGKRWGLISLDGVPTEKIVEEATKKEGLAWLTHFADAMPVHMMNVYPGGVPPFVTGSASMELEDLESHEITELSDVPSTAEAHDASVAAWTPPELPQAGAAKVPIGKAAEGDDGEWEDTDGTDEHAHHDDDDEEDEEDGDDEGDELGSDRLKYLATRHALDLVAQQFSLAIRAAQLLNLGAEEMKAAYLAAGGTVLSDDELQETAEKDPAVATFLQQMHGMESVVDQMQQAGGGVPQQGGQCQQQ